jgi:hypothetical protein
MFCGHPERLSSIAPAPISEEWPSYKGFAKALKKAHRRSSPTEPRHFRRRWLRDPIALPPAIHREPGSWQFANTRLLIRKPLKSCRAYEGACEALNLADRINPLTYLVAKKIIELAQRGERDPDQMRQQALKAFGRSG